MSKSSGRERTYRVECYARFGEINVGASLYVDAETEQEAREKAVERLESGLAEHDPEVGVKHGETAVMDMEEWG